MRPWTLAAIFFVALAMRLLPLPTVFTELGILPGALSDEYYHLRRIWYSVVHFPDVLSFDPYVNFPDGGRIHWPPGFDWLLAALARVLTGAGDRVAVETVAVWTPPVMGALTAVGVAWVGSAAFGAVGGATAGAVFAILPASWVFSRLGRVDHHVAVALAGVLLLGIAMAWLRESRRRPAWDLAVALGLAMAAPLLAWPGFLIHAGVVQAGLVAATLAMAERARAADRARSLALAHGVAAAVVLPFCVGPPFPQYGAWSPLVLSRFQPVWLGAAGVTLAAVALAWWRSPLGATRASRNGVAVGLGALGVGAALALSPGLREALFYASGWFTEADEVRRVVELQPLDPEGAASRYSLAFFVFPVAWLVVAVSAWRSASEDRALLLLWAAAFLLLTLEQRRFNNSFAAPFALVWGGAWALALPVWRRRLAGRTRLAPWAAAGGVAALLVALVPLVEFYVPQVKRSLWARDRSALTFVPPYKRVQLGAAWWLADHTPPTRGYLDPTVRPEYGVLCAWNAGHLIRHHARRPLVQDNFGVYGGKENFERAWAYYAALDEQEAVDLLEDLRVRYVVVDRGGAGTDPGAYDPRSMTHRLARLFGSAGRAGDPETGEPVEVPALVHHRLVYHVRSTPGGSLRSRPPQVSGAVYEVVQGARVRGTARPGARVEARILVSTQFGRRYVARATQLLEYRARTEADASGAWTLTLPYPTDVDFSESVRVIGNYEIASEGRAAPLEVPEAAVRAGAVVTGPSLDGPPPRARSPIPDPPTRTGPAPGRRQVE